MVSEQVNVVLTGFMGTGKTTVGRLLAERIGYELVDTDTIIESEHGTIASIFAERGEEEFRRLEQQVARELAERQGLVVSTGGRLMLDPENVESLGRTGRVFCLVADPEEILRRITADAARVERPLLAVDDPQNRIIELLAERADGYAKFEQIHTDTRTPAQIVAEIEAALARDPLP